MYFWNNYPFVRFSIALIIGIVGYDHFPFIWMRTPLAFPFIVASFIASIVFSYRFGFHKLRHVNGYIGLTLLCYCGGLVHHLSDERNHPSHYTSIDESIQGFAGVVVGNVHVTQSYHRYEFQLTHTFSKNVSISRCRGNILLYVKNEDAEPFQYGDQLSIFGSYYTLKSPSNPEAFDFKKFLSRKHIYAQAFVPPSSIRLLGKAPKSRLLNQAYTLRSGASNIIDKHLTSPSENAIAKALILGRKDHLSPELSEAYAAAGAMHVLAVSGLHVGIVYLIVLLLFGWLQRLGNTGRYFFGLTCLLCIWMYAMVTGLSPSVLRAGTMFSILIIGQISYKDGNVYNSLGIAAFILLLFEPSLTFSVGFQLSFAAVFGIVYLQPKIYCLFISRFWIIDKIWTISAVSIAAQLATLPLSLYYFHQFPTYFLLANVFVIPAAFIQLFLGLLMIGIDPIFNDFASWVAFCLHYIIRLTNTGIAFIHQLPYSQITWIHIDLLQVILAYAIALTFFAGLYYRASKTWLLSVALVFVWIGWDLYLNFQQSIKHELVFYDLNGSTAIDHIHGHHAQLHLDSIAMASMPSYAINPYRLASLLPPIETSAYSFAEAGFQNDQALRFGQICSQRIVLFDATTFHLSFKRPIETDIVIINNESVKSLKWLTKHVNAKLVIIGANNGYYFRKMIREEAAHLAIPLHIVREDGAIILPL